MAARPRTEVVTEVIVRGLTMAQVDVAMDECSDLAALNDEVLDWSVAADLGASTLTVELLLDFDDADRAIMRSRELVDLVAGGRVQHLTADLIPA